MATSTKAGKHYIAVNLCLDRYLHAPCKLCLDSLGEYNHSLHCQSSPPCFENFIHMMQHSFTAETLPQALHPFLGRHLQEDKQTW